MGYYMFNLCILSHFFTLNIRLGSLLAWTLYFWSQFDVNPTINYYFHRFPKKLKTLNTWLHISMQFSKFVQCYAKLIIIFLRYLLSIIVSLWWSLESICKMIIVIPRVRQLQWTVHQVLVKRFNIYVAMTTVL